MKKGVLSVVISILVVLVTAVASAKPIVIGVATDTEILDGFATIRGLKLAAEEINAAGGVNVADKKRPFKIEIMDTRDCEPGVPVSEALLAMEKILLDKGADFVIGPSRSEAAIAALGIISQHKKIYLSTCGCLSPKFHQSIAEDYNKFKYAFRIKLKRLLISFSIISFALMVAPLAFVGAGAKQGLAQPSEVLHYADMILYNGKVITVDERFSIAEAVAIRDGKFLAVGSSGYIQALGGANTKKINLKGKTVLPGVFDTHNHLTAAGERLYKVNFEAAKTVADALALIKEWAAKTKPGEWIRGSGWYALSQLKENRWITRWEIDSVALNNPVVLFQTGHDVMCNSYAMRLAKITKDTPDPPGGIIEKDPKTGEPNGVLHEGAQTLVTDLVPPFTLEQGVEIIEKSMKAMNEVGITSMVLGIETPESFKIFQHIWANRQPTMRASLMYRPTEEKTVSLDDWGKIMRCIGCYSDFGDDWLSFSGIKMIADGGFRISWTREPYPDPKIGYGVPLLPQEKLNELVAICNRYNWRVGIHCVGDATIDSILKAYEYANKEKPIAGRRFILIHACLMQPDQMERAKKLGVIACLQDFMWQRAASVEKDLGKERACRVSPARWIINNMGIERVSLGTDFHVNPYNPWICMYVFITRKDSRGVVYGADQAITREEAIRLYTSSAAYYTFDEDVKGSIESGKLADLVVISDDILTCPEEAIKDIKALMTIVDGRIVYEAK